MAIKAKLVRGGLVGATALTVVAGGMIYTTQTQSDDPTYSWSVTWANHSGTGLYKVRSSNTLVEQDFIDWEEDGISGQRKGKVAYANGTGGISVTITMNAKNVPSAQMVCTIAKVREDGGDGIVVSGPIYAKRGETQKCTYDVQGGS